MEKWKNLLKFLDQRIKDFGAQYRSFGLFGSVNYSISYFIMPYYLGTNEIAIARLIAFLLCIPLIFTDRWPARAKKYLNLYWILTLLYSFPIFGTYTFLENHLSAGWALNFSVGLFWLILLVDWGVFIILLSIGTPLGYLLFVLSGQEVIIQPDFSEISLASCLHTYMYAIIIGIIFARNREKNNEEKLQAMKLVAGSVAHELRTPLGAINMIAHTLASRLPTYQNAYTKAVEAQLVADTFTAQQQTYVEKTPESITALTQKANTVINMLLANLKENTKGYPLSVLSMKECAEEALQTYPFHASELSRIHLDTTQDFSFKGHRELTKHIFFNLFKNALYAIAQKGEIFISLEPGEKANKVIFKDTGKGIPEKELPHIFDRFYTKNTNHGTGIGLAFCQSIMQSFDASMTCDSVKDEYTIFTLSFPGAT